MIFLCFITTTGIIKTRIKISHYWTAQLIWWSINSFYWNYIGSRNNGFSLDLALLHYILDMLICISLTHGYRNFVVKRNWDLLYPKKLVWKIIPAILLIALLYAILVISKNYLMQWYFAPGFTERFWAYWQINRLAVFVAGARLMSIWILAYHLYIFAQREIRSTKEMARLAIIAKEANLRKLSAQLNPHFFFNSLNNIKSLVIDNPGAARRAIDLLSDLLRNSLYAKEELWVSVKAELELINDYLELEKLRFEERLLVKLEVGESVLPLLIPTLSIQTLVENAIKHGIDKQKNGGLIEIKIEKKDDRLKIAVASPGKLNQEINRSEGLGLTNLAERLQLQFNGKATFSIIQQDAQSVLATIIIPVHEKN